MAERDEFVEALMDQLRVEREEEAEILALDARISEDASFDLGFPGLHEMAESVRPEIEKKIAEFTGIQVPENLATEFAGLEDFKRLKGRKVFATRAAAAYVDELFGCVAREDAEGIASLIERDPAKYFVYSTYAIQYLSKISTTYGDYLDSVVYLNDFVLSRYPRIILYKRGQPFSAGYESVLSGYTGAVKMTLLEETIHSQQESLQKANREAAMQVNTINEELAGMILELDDSVVSSLYEYMQLQTVPDDFPMAKRANLFFMLNPDNFIVNVLGPDVMTFSRIEIDPKISEILPGLLEVYQRWLGPIQQHHAAFTVMEGMAEFAVHGILGDDADFASYLGTFMGTDYSSYSVRKSMGRDFVAAVHSSLGTSTFFELLRDPPSTHEIKKPETYLARRTGNR